MKVQIGRWGNSLAVRLPKELVTRLNLREGDEIDSDAIEAALSASKHEEAQTRREEALRRIRERRWELPAGWKFDREEAHERGAL